MLKFLKTLFDKSFSSVFNEVNEATEALYQQTVLQHVNRDRFYNWISIKVGRYALFGTNIFANVESSYVTVGVSQRDIGRKYKKKSEIEEAMRRLESAEISGSSNQSGNNFINVLESIDENAALLGAAGSGKTTTLRYLAVMAAKGIKIRGKIRFPFFIQVRDLQESRSPISKSLIKILEELEVKVPSRVVKRLLKNGAILLIDGIDETSERQQINILKEISYIQAKYCAEKDRTKKLLICISGRPYSLSREMPGFFYFEALPLEIEGKRTFIKNYFSEINPERGSELLDLLRDHPKLFSLGSTPLLMAIICALYHNELEIPKDKEELFERCLDGLMGGWDYFRKITRLSPLKDLTISKRKLLLSNLAGNTHSHRDLVFSESDVSVIHAINDTKKRVPELAIEPIDVLNSLYNDFGILVERAPGLFSFSHLQFQEYLCAKYVITNRTEDALVDEYLNNPNHWEEVLMFTVRMLPDATKCMVKITQRLDYSSIQSLWVYRRLWKDNPICLIKEKESLIKHTLVEFNRILAKLRFAYTINGYRIELEYNETLPPTKEESNLILCLNQLMGLYLENSMMPVADDRRVSLKQDAKAKDSVSAVNIVVKATGTLTYLMPQ